MQLPDFKKRVTAAFGERMEHATPANVREFLDQLQREDWLARRPQQTVRGADGELRYEIPSEPQDATWESLVRDFFRDALDTDPEQSVITLWIFALDMAYSNIEELHSEEMSRLFRDVQE